MRYEQGSCTVYDRVVQYCIALNVRMWKSLGLHPMSGCVQLDTCIGYGSPAKEGTPAAHHGAFGAEEAQKIRERYGRDPKEAPFTVPEAVYRCALPLLLSLSATTSLVSSLTSSLIPLLTPTRTSALSTPLTRHLTLSLMPFSVLQAPWKPLFHLCAPHATWPMSSHTPCTPPPYSPSVLFLPTLIPSPLVSLCLLCA